MSTLANGAFEAEPPAPPRAVPGAAAVGSATTIAGRYEIDLETPLGVGGMALVYRGKDLRTRRDVAVKTLRPEYRREPETRARFRREARLLAFLAHPNVVRVFDFVEDRGASWVVLEHVTGRSLKDLIAERGPFPPADAARLIEQTASALGHLHARGLVHLDVKPQNLLLTDDRRLKLIDFGLAQPAGQPQEAIGGRR
jgi:serine/threonine-protein kinase